MAKRPSAQTLLKYKLTLARVEMINKITGFIEKRPNAELLKIYRQFFRDDIHSLAIASSLVCYFCKDKGLIPNHNEPDSICPVCGKSSQPKELLNHEQEWKECSTCLGVGYISQIIEGVKQAETCTNCKGTGKICTDPKPLSEQPIASSKPNSPV